MDRGAVAYEYGYTNFIGSHYDHLTPRTGSEGGFGVLCVHSVVICQPEQSANRDQAVGMYGKCSRVVGGMSALCYERSIVSGPSVEFRLV